MGLLNQTKRIELEGGEWVEVRPLTIGALRAMRRASSQVEVLPGEEADEVQGFELSKLALEACIVAWSDEAPVTPENIAELPYAIMFQLTGALGLGDDSRPLPSGESSTDSSEEIGQ